jgi:hypothetical protein
MFGNKQNVFVISRRRRMVKNNYTSSMLAIRGARTAGCLSVL